MQSSKSEDKLLTKAQVLLGLGGISIFASRYKKLEGYSMLLAGEASMLFGFRCRKKVAKVEAVLCPAEFFLEAAEDAARRYDLWSGWLVKSTENFGFSTIQRTRYLMPQFREFELARPDTETLFCLKTRSYIRTRKNSFDAMTRAEIIELGLVLELRSSIDAMLVIRKYDFIGDDEKPAVKRLFSEIFDPHGA